MMLAGEQYYSLEISPQIKLRALGPWQLAILHHSDEHEDYVMTKHCQRELSERLYNTVMHGKDPDEYTKFVYRAIKSMIVNARLYVTEMHTIKYDEKNISLIDTDRFKTTFRKILDSIGFYALINDDIQRVETQEAKETQARELADKRAHEVLVNELKVKKYKLADTYNTKEKLQGLYIEIVKRVTGKNCYFDRAVDLEHCSSVSKTSSTFGRSTLLCGVGSGYIQLVSRTSKASDFLEMLYAVTTGRSMLDTSMTKFDMLESIPGYSYKAIIIVMYRLGVIRSTDEFYKLSGLTKKDKVDIARLEQKLGFN